MLKLLQREVRKLADPQRAKDLSRFFKTKEGEYGAGDIFCGLTVPQSRTIAAKFPDLSVADLTILIKSKIHEERMIALIILVSQFRKGDEKKQKDIFDFYLSHTKYSNNWDLVDLSADKIVGGYLKTRERSVLLRLAKSENLWEKRISMIATFEFIKNLKEYKDTFVIADILLHDKHDLIQKAVGWMLREVGKRASEKALIDYLKPRYKTMPRTTLRYAIERFSPDTRKKYLQGMI